MRRLVWSVVLTAALAALAPAQKRVSSEWSKLPPELGDKPESVLKVEKLKGTLSSVDLQKRTVTIGEKVFTFPTAAGREKVSLSKKVARELGKKSLRLEDAQPGWQVSAAYYPSLGTLMELTVEKLSR